MLLIESAHDRTSSSPSQLFVWGIFCGIQTPPGTLASFCQAKRHGFCVKCSQKLHLSPLCVFVLTCFDLVVG